MDYLAGEEGAVEGTRSLPSPSHLPILDVRTPASLQGLTFVLVTALS